MESDLGRCTVQIDNFFMRAMKDPLVGTFMSSVDSYWGICRAIRVESKGAKSGYTVK
jgi:hypothetical protein